LHPEQKSLAKRGLHLDQGIAVKRRSSSKAEIQLSGTIARSTEPPEPPLDHPISPDEQYCFVERRNASLRKTGFL
jgi:hypothetical protein